MRTARTRGESSIYHIVSRGVGQQIIFESDADRRRYLESLETLVGELGGALLAWCLMDNHVHLLLSMDLEVASTMMRRLNSGYALYFNLAHGRTGHLFQGRFKSEPVDDDEYLLTVVRYIHQNPLRAGIAEDCRYRWSSYGQYASGNPPAGAEAVTDLFGSASEFVAFHREEGVEERCLDITTRRRRLDDDAALAAAVDIFGDEGLASIKSLPRGRRDDALAALKDRGLTVRQIQRLTGVSLGTISKA